jgi:PadR family transcriptional regulator, regulatory protein PadR
MSIRMTHITALVLRAIAAGHRYGFDIMDAAGLASGTVYPVLRRLEAAGLLRSHWEQADRSLEGGRPRRRFYAVTEEGLGSLADAERRLAGTIRFLGELPSPAKGSP